MNQKKSFLRILLQAALVSLASIGLSSSAADSSVGERPASSGGEVMNFSLLDYKGRYYELRRADARVVVLFFTGNGCPVARQSIEKLKSLREHFSSRGVVIWLIDSNAQDD